MYFSFPNPPVWSPLVLIHQEGGGLPPHAPARHLDLLVKAKGLVLGDRLLLNARSFTVNSSLFTSTTDTPLAQYLSDPPRLVAELLRQAFYLSSMANASDETMVYSPSDGGNGGVGGGGNGGLKEREEAVSQVRGRVC